jgi:TM2 domain-containing membrane protein YozV
MFNGYYGESASAMCISIFFCVISLIHIVNDILFITRVKRLSAVGESPYKQCHRAVFCVVLMDGILGIVLSLDFRTVFGILTPTAVLCLLAGLTCATVVGVAEWFLYTFELILNVSLEQHSATRFRIVELSCLALFISSCWTSVHFTLQTDLLVWLVLPYIMLQILGILATILSLKSAKVFGKFYFETKTMGKAMSRDQELQNTRMYQKAFGKLFSAFVVSLFSSLGIAIAFPLMIKHHKMYSAFFARNITQGYVFNPEVPVILVLISVVGLLGVVFCWVPLNGEEDVVTRLRDKAVVLLWSTVGEHLAEKNTQRLSKAHRDSLEEIKGPSRAASRRTSMLGTKPQDAVAALS